MDVGKLMRLLSRIEHLAGDVAEFGVYRGDTFAVLANWAFAHSRMAHAFDSFIGMADPGPRDSTAYWRGKFSVGGVDRFRDLMTARLKHDSYKLWPGFIPESLSDATTLLLVFSYVDLDHYDPTIDALEFCYQRTVPEGLIVCDDVFDLGHGGASDAVNEFIATCPGLASVGRLDNNQLVLRKVRC
jgi:hypothetical protein